MTSGWACAFPGTVTRDEVEALRRQADDLGREMALVAEVLERAKAMAARAAMPATDEPRAASRRVRIHRDKLPGDSA